MKDLINGQPEQDIDHCGNCIHSADSLEICVLRTCKYAIGELIDCYEPKQIEQPWIPCSERLPDRFGKMLVTFVPAAGTLWTRVIIAHYSDLMGIAKPCFWIGNVGKSDFANITSQVVAWMPLPEPYKEDDHETD